MFICKNCKEAFDEPKYTAYPTGDGDRNWTDWEASCPYCGCDDYSEAERCPKCGEWMVKGEYLCEKCKRELYNKFTGALKEVITCDAEADQLDWWMDGNSFHDRIKYDGF